jgi:hypothetical protein
MLQDAAYAVSELYRVEVSGWDSMQTFFVEKAKLEWSEESGKNVVMGHPLREKAIIFVRLLQPTASERSYPIPYEAEFMATTPEGRHQYRLKAIRFGTGLAESPAA